MQQDNLPQSIVLESGIKILVHSQENGTTKAYIGFEEVESVASKLLNDEDAVIRQEIIQALASVCQTERPMRFTAGPDCVVASVPAES